MTDQNPAFSRFIAQASANLIALNERFPGNQYALAALLEETGKLISVLVQNAHGKKTAEDVYHQGVFAASLAASVALFGDSEYSYIHPLDKGVSPGAALEKFMEEVVKELHRAQTKFPINHKAVAVIGEEVGEVCNALLEHAWKKATAAEVYQECVQTFVVISRLIVQGDTAYPYTNPFQH